MKKLLLFLFLIPLFLAGCTSDYQAPVAEIAPPGHVTVTATTSTATPVVKKAPVSREPVANTNTAKVAAPAAPSTYQAPIPAKVISPAPELSNDNSYVNSAGNKVHSPAYSSSIPAGASARCGDGTYSFSQSRRGTCSHHGGVREWLN